MHAGRLSLTLFVFLCIEAVATAQTRILPLGDSITNGGQNYASYRYALWFDLRDAGYDVEFVGTQNTLFSNSTPTPAWYPQYNTEFDRDHDGYWGWRTDAIANEIDAIAATTTPDFVLIHLGTNDIGQMGAAGLTNADVNLRTIVARLRAARPDVTIFLAQIIGIGIGSGYGANADQVDPLNQLIATIASDLDSAQSPMILVDQNTSFDVPSMMQADELHPNLLGEAQMADEWFAALAQRLVAGNLPPTVTMTSPQNGAAFVADTPIVLAADATDADGTVVAVRFLANGVQLFTDSTPPYEFSWSDAAVGGYTLTAQAEDNDGRIAISSAVTVSVAPAGLGTPLAIQNASFELPVLADFALAEGPGVIEGWTFAATPNTFLGIFNPPAGSYSSAGGSATPTGADGSNVAFLFNDGGPSESVSATQVLSDVLQTNSRYTLSVAIGKFLPDQPFSFSTYGGYQIELLAGDTVIASDVDSIDPPFDRFQDAIIQIDSSAVAGDAIGQALAVRLNISATDADRSTHFDNIRLNLRDLDPDGDGVDEDSDNCSEQANPDQVDSNGDGFGNRCDPDLNNDGIVNVIDLGMLRLAFFSTPNDSNWNADADFTGDGIINAGDLGILRSFFFAPPGPSGLVQ